MSEFHYVEEVTVRFGDLDINNHVNNVAYFRYLEEARGGYFDNVVGIPFESTETVIAEQTIKYRHELSRGQPVTVAVRTAKVGESSLILEYEIRTTDPETGEKQIAATAETVQVFVDSTTGQAGRIPDEWRNAIQKHDPP
jgi:acyl-CoA thioester hydrolase